MLLLPFDEVCRNSEELPGFKLQHVQRKVSQLWDCLPACLRDRWLPVTGMDCSPCRTSDSGYGVQWSHLHGAAALQPAKALESGTRIDKMYSCKVQQLAFAHPNEVPFIVDKSHVQLILCIPPSLHMPKC